jgi:hypothetical protein
MISIAKKKIMAIFRTSRQFYWSASPIFNLAGQGFFATMHTLKYKKNTKIVHITKVTR